MIKTVIGLLILFIPFILIFKFTNMKIRFVEILTLVIAFHLFLAIFTQTINLFTYKFVLILNIVILVIVIAKSGLSKLVINTKDSLKNIDWVLVLIIVMAFLHLFSVHHNYTGKYSSVNVEEYQEAKNMKYVYPYFVDEWYAIAFIRDSINSMALPIKNPLTYYDSYFVNLELPFHSFLSEIFLLLDLDPLIDYTKIAIFTGLLIVILVYLFFRVNNIDKFPAAIISLSVLYITNGANLPGIWNLIPLTFGIILTLSSFVFFSVDNRKMALFSSVMALLFYPPLFIFNALAVIVYFLLADRFMLRERARNIIYYIMLLLIVGLVFLLSYFLYHGSLNNFISYILFTKILYPTLVSDSVPNFIIYKIIPVYVLIFAVLGTVLIIRKKPWLFFMLLVGIGYWLFYSFATLRIIIDYERVVTFSSVIIVLSSGFGLNYLLKYIKDLIFLRNSKIPDYILLVILLLFFISSFSYTARENWRYLTITHLNSGATFLPAAPANMYLHQEDILFFSRIKNQTFLSHPWKGTVIGVATNNYPISSKAGTITINPRIFDIFMNADCNAKYEMAVTRTEYYEKIDYVYSPAFDCQGFRLINVSSEGFYLYEVQAG